MVSLSTARTYLGMHFREWWPFARASDRSLETGLRYRGRPVVQNRFVVDRPRVHHQLRSCWDAERVSLGCKAVHVRLNSRGMPRHLSAQRVVRPKGISRIQPSRDWNISRYHSKLCMTSMARSGHQLAHSTHVLFHKFTHTLSAYRPSRSR